jgi:putative transposase
MSGDHNIKLLCETLGVSRSGFYDWLRVDESARAKADAELTVKIDAVYRQSRHTYGSPRVTAVLRMQGSLVGRRRVARLMRKAGLRGRQRRRYRVVTTNSDHDNPVAPNLLASRPVPKRPNQTWLSDMTYVSTAEGWLYLAGILDLGSRRLVGWAMSEAMDTALPLAALSMAVRQCHPPPGLIHHSDRGTQYASGAYRDKLAEHGIVASMSRLGHCYDNAAMEAFWSTMKMEMVYRRRFLTRAQARTAIFDFIEGFYNRNRIHSALQYRSPLDYEASIT